MADDDCQGAISKWGQGGTQCSGYVQCCLRLVFVTSLFTAPSVLHTSDCFCLTILKAAFAQQLCAQLHHEVTSILEGKLKHVKHICYYTVRSDGTPRSIRGLPITPHGVGFFLFSFFLYYTVILKRRCDASKSDVNDPSIGWLKYNDQSRDKHKCGA